MKTTNLLVLHLLGNQETFASNGFYEDSISLYIPLWNMWKLE